MPDSQPENMQIAVDADKRRFRFTQRGMLNKATALQSCRVLFGADGFNPTYDTLVDYRAITHVDISFPDITAILDEVAAIDTRSGKCALVVGEQMGRFMLAKLFCDSSSIFGKSRVRYKAFQTLENAEPWLDKPAP